MNMPEYYFDVETNATGEKPDIENDEILTIQYQRVSTKTGKPEGQLQILKSWESSEKEIYGKDVPLKTLLYHHPSVDIKSILVILNGGEFKGASMEKFCGKKSSGAIVPEWYSKMDYPAIEKYIIDEAEAFLQFYQKLKIEMPLIVKS
ncbi:MAG: hypothetical protein NT055_01035 [Nitrospirae bacterium]|nr:hypothetical protein [Nitrospirota bacterium]